MAFNPFDAVRKRSKAIFAVVTIIVMFTFVLSSGAVGTGQDFFDQVGSLFNTKGRGDVVAVAYGNKIRDADLAETRRQRTAANDFILSAIHSSYMAWARELDADLKGSRLSFETRNALGQFVTLKVNSEIQPQKYQEFLASFGRFGPESQPLMQAISRAKEGTEDKKALEAAAAIIMHDLTRPLPIFLGIGFDSDRDLVDFTILLRKADQMGVVYSRDAVRELVQRETNGRLSKTDNAAIEQRMRQGGKYGTTFSSDWLIDAVGNEFRARDTFAILQGQSLRYAAFKQELMLPAILLGIDPSRHRLPGEPATLSAPPGVLTPYEFWEFYKDRCSEHKFSILEVPAEAYLDQVKEPDKKQLDKELEDLFKRYRGELPEPAKETPGFKDPRKVKVEFVALDAKAERITKALPAVRAASVFLSATAGALSGDATTLATQASHQADTHPAIGGELVIRHRVRQKVEANWSPYRMLEQYDFTPRDTSVFHPRPIVSALGFLAGHPDITTVAGAAAAVHQQVEVIDHQTRIPFLLQPWLVPFNPNLGNAVGMPAFAYALNPKLPPEGLYIKEVTETVRKEQRHQLFLADVGALESKLSELMKEARQAKFARGAVDTAKVEKEKEEARKYLDQWLKDRGLTATGTKEPVDEFGVVSAPELKPLNDLATPEPDGTNSLSKRLFQLVDPQRGIYFPGPFHPYWFPEEPLGDSLDKPNHLVWISEEVQAKAYTGTLANADNQTRGEMSKRVLKAWRLEKARALARAEADRLAEQVRQLGRTAATDAGGVEKQLKDLAEQKKVRKFEIDRLALLRYQPGATQAQISYEPPKIDKKMVVFPTPNFAEQLLALRKEPLGGVAVLPDGPKRHFYVACRIGQTEKTIEEFRDVFNRATATPPAQDPLYEQIALPEARVKANQIVLKRLRADAKLEEKEGFKNRERGEGE
jgi:hypothetical protein